MDPSLWKKHYESAIQEPDLTEAEKNVHLTEEAMFLRWQQLAGNPDHHNERLAMKRASAKLLRVKTQRLGWPAIESSATQPEHDMTSNRDQNKPNPTRASVEKEMAKPRMAKSARIAELKQDASRVAVEPSVTMPGSVDKIILSSRLGQPEKVQIGVDGADKGYRDLRIENILVDEHGDDVSLTNGAPVEITITAHPKK
jgi:hypothetical protein